MIEIKFNFVGLGQINLGIMVGVVSECLEGNKFNMVLSCVVNTFLVGVNIIVVGIVSMFLVGIFSMLVELSIFF